MSDKHKNIKRLYWDSNVFLSAINATAERLPVINAILDDCDHGEVEIYTSVLTVTEVAFAEFEKRDRLLDPQIEAKIDKLWLPPSPIRLEELSHHIANDARSMMR
jgi:predicted nucleic acid-binding protein